jgi:hypothetical protein
VPVGRIEDVVNAVGHCATDDEIAGRALAVGLHKILDLGDDAAGMDAAEAMRDFWRTGSSWVCSSDGEVDETGSAASIVDRENVV